MTGPKVPASRARRHAAATAPGRSVTVQAPDPAWAEIWTKALFLEGARGIARLARSRGLAAWWITREGRVEMTPAARQRPLWLESEAA